MSDESQSYDIGGLRANYRWNEEMEAHEWCFFEPPSMANGALAMARSEDGLALRIITRVERAGFQRATTIYLPVAALPAVAAAMLQFDDHPPAPS